MLMKYKGNHTKTEWSLSWKIEPKFFQHKCGELRDVIPFVQFKKREKHPWKSDNFSKVTN